MQKMHWLIVVLFLSCAGWGRQCSSYNAERFGSDWIVLQYGFDGRPINCWVLKETSMDNEAHSDGIYWKDADTGHLVHVAGWYNRIQIEKGGKESAAKLLGIDLTQCVNGRYGAVK